MLKLNNSVLNIIVNSLLMVWQLPQLLVGLILLACFRDSELYTNNEAKIKVLKVNKGLFLNRACFSLGPIIFTTPLCDDNTIRHESGHSKQSIYLGPVYLLAVGIPSLFRYIWMKYFKKSNAWYLNGYPENWAEKLGHTHR
jgi:hypothetical protein